ncbi:MAG: hypothetical protein V3V02_10570, partial [Rhizobiaceae bacterium]
DETFIDPNAAALRIFDVSSLGGTARGQVVNTPPPFDVMAGKIGQVFGLAFDDGKREDTEEIIPNLYATATSLHGIQIVEDDTDEDGRPERLRRGKAGARFMEAQFGADAEPGSIWKIDGRTGEVTLFATIQGNSGAGLGNIAFDKRNRQLLVSDIETGKIHRIGLDGFINGSFDHGENGRPSAGAEPVADDGAVMDIAGGAFDSEDAETWGYTQAERRVWGVAVHRNRLYYAVEDKLQIWSVGIGRDGQFLADARWELDVKAEKDYPVTDIAFDKRGFMYLAQRGTIENRYDYSRFAKSGKGEVMRYFKEKPDDPATPSVWVETPQTYATGFPNGHQQTAGGIDLQYGYDAEGFINRDACDATLFKSGDNLRDNADLIERLGPDGPVIVHGAQLTPVAQVRPANQPPFGSWFFDFDATFEDPEVRGHIGDVEVYRPCAGGRGAGSSGYPGYGEPWEYPGKIPDTKSACAKVEDIVYECAPDGSLIADLYLAGEGGVGSDSLKTTSRSPGINVSPTMQTQPVAGIPFTLNLDGTWPGDRVRLGLCLYKSSDARKGGYFPCCKVNITIKTPPTMCR